MSQKDILDYLLKVRRPIQKKELSFLRINNVAITRGLCRLKKNKIIDSTKSSNRKPSFYFLR